MHRRLPSLNALRAFEAAARHESFSRAGDELFVTHAAVSRHIRDLETWLNAALFERTGRGVVLTEIGESYARRLTRALDDVAEATAAVLSSVEAPQLNISVEEAFATLWLVPRLVRFAKKYSDVELSLDPDDGLINFRADPFDLAIRYGAGNWPDVDATLLVRLKVFPVCSPEYRQRESIESPGDLKNAMLLHEETKAWWADWLDEVGLKHLTPHRGPLFQGNLAVEAAAAGQGIALGDNVSAADGLLEGWLVRPFDVSIQEDAYYIVSAKGGKQTAQAEAFKAWVVQEMNETQAQLAQLLDG
jgi:LysR family glycine cleavage system transcriptional activator